MIEYTDEKDSLNLPKPRSKNSFCNVCRQTYEDYLSHIQSDYHKKSIRNSNFNQYILELVDKLNPSQKSSLNFSQNTHSTQDDDDVEILYCRPKKKVKPLQEVADMPFYPMINGQIAPPPHLNLGHGTYFPNGCQTYIPNQGYGFIYPLNNNFPTVEINFNNQLMMQNHVNFPFPAQNYGFVHPWSDIMAQYQRNLIPFTQMSESNPVMQHHFNPFSGFLNNHQNYGQRVGQQRPIALQQNGFGQRMFWGEEKKLQAQVNQVANVDQLKNFPYERQ